MGGGPTVDARSFAEANLLLKGESSQLTTEIHSLVVFFRLWIPS